MKASLILLLALSSLLLTQCTNDEAKEAANQSHPEEKEKDNAMTSSEENPDTPATGGETIDFSKLTEEEWKARLTPEQYYILRQAGTERANGKVYQEFKAQGGGTYYCAGCDTELFRSDTKFDSHCGWPSFYDPSKAKNVTTDVDYHLGYARTEVRCAVCDGHLGHVFSGESFESLGGKPTPTGQRYCINGTVLKFVPDGEKEGGE